MNGAAAMVALSLIVSGAAVLLLRRNANRLPHAAPNDRSLHEHAVPRAGGLAILAGASPALGMAFLGMHGQSWVWIGAIAAIAAISFADDLRGMPASVRLAVQTGAALAVAATIFSGAPGACFAAAVAIVWGANLFNFMDGSDGIAASMAIVGFTAYALAAALAGTSWLAYAALAAATVPFFFANRPPAKMFMGDVGAVPLGFLAAAFGVAGAAERVWPAWFPVLVFLPFIADATLTLALRAARRERVWQAHRSHFYQRLNTLGAGHRGTLAIYGAAMLACAAIALACLAIAPRAGPVVLTAALALHLLAFAAIDYHWRKNQERRE